MSYKNVLQKIVYKQIRHESMIGDSLNNKVKKQASKQKISHGLYSWESCLPTKATPDHPQTGWYVK